MNSVTQKKITKLLINIPNIQDLEGRRALLSYAGLEDLIPIINFSGDTFTFVNNLVLKLDSYGQMHYGQSAITVLLNAVKDIVGQEKKELIDEIILIELNDLPNLSGYKSPSWYGSEDIQSVHEKIIGENTLRPISFLEKGIQVSRAVAYIGIQMGDKRGTGTGFLIRKDLLITNNHVIPNKSIAKKATFRFNFQESYDGNLLMTKDYKFKGSGIFITDEDLDYTILSLEESPGIEWGWLPLLENPFIGERVNIIQHPKGRPKEISLQNNFIEYEDDKVLQYVTSTQPGSSGSPVLNDNWEVVAIHHSGGMINEPISRRRYFRNEGIKINSIILDLPEGVIN